MRGQRLQQVGPLVSRGLAGLGGAHAVRLPFVPSGTTVRSGPDTGTRLRSGVLEAGRIQHQLSLTSHTSANFEAAGVSG